MATGLVGNVFGRVLHDERGTGIFCRRGFGWAEGWRCCQIEVMPCYTYIWIIL